MQFTESEIQEILRENQILKQDLNDAREELEATARLYDAMVVGTRNLLLLIDEGGSGCVRDARSCEDKCAPIPTTSSNAAAMPAYVTQRVGCGRRTFRRF